MSVSRAQVAICRTEERYVTGVLTYSMEQSPS